MGGNWHHRMGGFIHETYTYSTVESFFLIRTNTKLSFEVKTSATLHRYMHTRIVNPHTPKCKTKPHSVYTAPCVNHIPHVNRSRQRRTILSRETKFIQRNNTRRTCTAAYSYPHNSILCVCIPFVVLRTKIHVHTILYAQIYVCGAHILPMQDRLIN